MKVVFGGSLGLRHGGTDVLIGALTKVLHRLGHTVLHWGPASSEGERYSLHLQRIVECDLLVAFVDDLTFELGADIQEAIRAEKPVLCVTDGRVPVSSPMLIGVGQALLVDVTHYADFEDLANKMMCYIVFVSKRDQALQTLHA